MKKAGEKAKSFLAHAVFIAIIVLGLYFIVTSTVNLTGYVILDAATAKTKLESALSSSALFSQVPQSSICVIINDPEQPLSLQAVKGSTGWTVSEMVGFCSGFNSEDVIVQFPDYDSFSAIVDNPSPRNIAQGAIDQDYQILKSKYVELGGNVICDAAFKVKYCPALKTMATPEQLIEGDLACCIDKLTRSQRQLLEEHLQQGTYEDEIGILQEPSGMAGMSMTTSIIILGVIVLVVVGVVAGVMLKGKGPKPPAEAGKKPPTGKPGITPGVTQGAGMPGAGAPGAGQTVAGAGTPPAGAAQPTMQTPTAHTGAAAQAESPQVTELRNYVKQVLKEGYAPDEIRGHLLQIGWEPDTADKVIREAYQQAQQELQQGQ